MHGSAGVISLRYVSTNDEYCIARVPKCCAGVVVNVSKIQQHGLMETDAKSWQNEGTTMAQLWHNHGTTLAQPWHNYGTIMAQLRHKHSTSLAPENLQQFLRRGLMTCWAILPTVAACMLKITTPVPRGGDREGCPDHSEVPVMLAQCVGFSAPIACLRLALALMLAAGYQKIRVGL